MCVHIFFCFYLCSIFADHWRSQQRLFHENANETIPQINKIQKLDHETNQAVVTNWYIYLSHVCHLFSFSFCFKKKNTFSKLNKKKTEKVFLWWIPWILGTSIVCPFAHHPHLILMNSQKGIISKKHSHSPDNNFHHMSGTKNAKVSFFLYTHILINFYTFIFKKRKATTWNIDLGFVWQQHFSIQLRTRNWLSTFSPP